MVVSIGIDSDEENDHYLNVGMDIFGTFTTKHYGRDCNGRKAEHYKERFSETGPTLALTYHHNFANVEE